MSLALLLETELRVDMEEGFKTFGISAPGPYVPRVESWGVTHISIPALTRAWDPGRDVRAARQLAAAIRSIRPDILHTHNPKTGVMGRIIGRSLRVPVVVNTCHGLWTTTTDNWQKRRAVYLIEGLAARASHAELFQNDEDRKSLGRLVPLSRTRVVGNGIDLGKYRPDATIRATARRTLGISEDTIAVGGAGRIVAEKGVVDFCAVANRLSSRADFFWAGPADPSKRDAVAPLSSSVRFVGELTDMNEYYNALDIFVLPSFREGLSRSAMEAGACALPMVLSNIRGCREIGGNEVEVLLVQPGDTNALAFAVNRLVTDSDLRQKLGAAARDRICASFDQRVVAGASLATYREVAIKRGLFGDT